MPEATPPPPDATVTPTPATADTTPTPPPQATPVPPAPNYPMGIVIPGKPGYVKSPYPGEGNLGDVDVRGFNPGQLVRSPYNTKEIFVVPQQ